MLIALREEQHKKMLLSQYTEKSKCFEQQQQVYRKEQDGWVDSGQQVPVSPVRTPVKFVAKALCDKDCM